MEQLPLLPERLILLVYVRSRHLERHVLVRDLWDIREEEHGGETEDEDADGEVDPLHALQCSDIVGGLGEEDVGSEHGADDGADGVEGLGEVDTDFGVAGWPAD